jgi:hypothetical protein
MAAGTPANSGESPLPSVSIFVNKNRRLSLQHQHCSTKPHIFHRRISLTSLLGCPTMRALTSNVKEYHYKRVAIVCGNCVHRPVKASAEELHGYREERLCL